MAGDQGEVAEPLGVVEHGDVAVAEPAVQNLQHQFSGCGLEQRALRSLQGGSGFAGLPDGDGHGMRAADLRSTQAPPELIPECRQKPLSNAQG